MHLNDLPDIKVKPFDTWTCDEVCSWLTENNISPKNIDICRLEELTGITLMDMTVNELRGLGMKFGRKIYCDLRCQTLAV
jgi:hypothetical protein